MGRFSAVVLAALVSVSPTASFAHAALVSATPAQDSMVAAPRSIKLTFSEKIAPAFSGAGLTMDDGMAIGVAVKVSADGKTLTGTPTGAFMKGKYKLSWHVTSVDDGHRTEGAYSFTVK